MLTAPQLSPVDFLTRARFEPYAAVVMVVGVAWYGRCVVRIRRAGRAWPLGRTAAFGAAWLTVAVAVFSGLSDFGPTNFSAFASLYMMVGLIAPALLAVSAPISLGFQASADPGRVRVVGRTWFKVLSNPFLSWMLFAASMFVLFFTGLFGAVLGGRWAQQVAFAVALAVGFLYYWPLADVDPRPWRLGTWPRILYLLLLFPVYAILGMALESQTTPLIAPGISVNSLHLGAAVFWVAAEGLSLCGAIWIFVTWLRAEQRRIQTHDRDNEAAAARQLALWRASRDAAARAASN